MSTLTNLKRRKARRGTACSLWKKRVKSRLIAASIRYHQTIQKVKGASGNRDINYTTHQCPAIPNLIPNQRLKKSDSINLPKNNASQDRHSTGTRTCCCQKGGKRGRHHRRSRSKGPETKRQKTDPHHRETSPEFQADN